MGEQEDRLARYLFRIHTEHIEKRKAEGAKFALLDATNSHLVDSHSRKTLRGLLEEAGYKTRIHKSTGDIMVEW